MEKQVPESVRKSFLELFAHRAPRGIEVFNNGGVSHITGGYCAPRPHKKEEILTVGDFRKDS